jgi:hypothetical protein
VDLETFTRIVASDREAPRRSASAMDVATPPAAAPRFV